MSAGERIHHWELEAPLGRGGMGTVWRARDTRDDRRVALKWVDCDEPAARAALANEARLLTHLSHPGVARILASGASRGRLWYVRELVDGARLDEWAGLRGATPEAVDETMTRPTPSKSTPTPGGRPRPVVPLDWSAIAQRLAPLLDVCETLAHLHGLGCLHLDLKPGNVMVTPAGRAILIDFGLAVRRGADGLRETLDRRWLAGGTPAYRAPECEAGESVDARADLYALGCTLYHLITGGPPFEADDPDRLAALHRHARPRPPGDVGAEVPATLETLVLGLLEKAPKDRPPYAADVAALLRALLPSDLAAGPARLTTASRPRPYLYRAPLLGRDAEQARAILALRSPGLHLLSGAAGVGKTRFALAMTRELEHIGRRVVLCSCLPEAAPLGPLLESLTPHLGARTAGALTEALPGTAGVVDAAPSREVLVAQVRRAFASLGDSVLIVDDVTHADSLLLAVIEDLARRRILPILVLTVEGEPVGLEAIAVDVFTLSRLPDLTIDEWVRHVLASASVPETLIGTVCEAAEGLPLQAAEWLQAALDDGFLTRTAGQSWQVAPGRAPDAPPVPASVESVVATRRAGWDDPASDLATLLAIAGSPSAAPLPVTVLEEVAIARGWPERTLDAALTTLANDAAIRFADGGVSLTPRTLAPAIRASLDPATRAARHRDVARALMATGAPPERIARHHEAAGDVDAARLAHLAAGGAAAAKTAHAEAERWFGRAIALSSPGPTRAAARLVLVNEVFVAQGRWGDALEVTRQAVDELDEAPAALRIEALCTLAEAARRQGLRTEAAAALARAGHGEPAKENNAIGAALESRRLRTLALLRRDEGRHPEALAAAEAAVEAAASASAPGAGRTLERALADALTVRAGVLMTAGELDRAEVEYRRAAAAHHRLGDRRREAVALADLGALLGDLGRSDDAIAASEAALEAQLACDDLFSAAITWANLGSEHQAAGRTALAIEFFERARGELMLLGANRYLGPVLVNIGDCQLAAGDADRAVETLREAHVCLAAIGPGPWTRYALALLARALREGPRDLERAGVSLSTALVDLADDDPERALYEAERGALALARGDEASARAALARARTLPHAQRHLAAAVARLEVLFHDG